MSILSFLRHGYQMLATTLRAPGQCVAPLLTCTNKCRLNWGSNWTLVCPKGCHAHVHRGQSNSYETGQRFVISLTRDGPLSSVSCLSCSLYIGRVVWYYKTTSVRSSCIFWRWPWCATWQSLPWALIHGHDGFIGPVICRPSNQKSGLLPQ